MIKFLGKIYLPQKIQVNLPPKRLIYFFKSTLNSKKIQEIGKNALKKVQHCKKTYYCTKTSKTWL